MEKHRTIVLQRVIDKIKDKKEEARNIFIFTIVQMQCEVVKVFNELIGAVSTCAIYNVRDFVRQQHRPICRYLLAC